MLTIEVRLLGGRYRAGDFEDRAEPEWPPHPARLFYAAVHGAHTAGGDPLEIETLEWWESLGAPAIECSDRIELPDGTTVDSWASRTGVDHYVRGNYARSWSADIQGQWERIAEKERRLDELLREGAAQKEIGAAERALEKARAKVVADTARVTAAGIPASGSVVESVLEVLPDNRDRQARQFPAVTPDNPVIRYGWSYDIDPDRARVLDTILARIGRIGHSASTVACRLIDEPLRPTWVPTRDRSDVQLRTVTDGVHEALVEEFARHQGRRERNMPAVISSYRRPRERTGPPLAAVGAGEWIVLPFPVRGGLPLPRTADIGRAVRAALMSHAQQPVPAFLSGHRSRDSGTGPTGPLADSHLGVLSLPNVTHVHSDGQIRAVALTIPDGTAQVDIDAVVEALAAWWDPESEGYRLTLPGGVVRILGAAAKDRADDDRDAAPGRVGSRAFWARSGREWSTVTPIALDRHPKVSRSADFDALNAAVAPVVAGMLTRAGLPEPVEILASPVAMWPSVPPVAGGAGGGRPGRRTFPQYRVGNDPQRRRFTTHLTVRFAEPVAGPLIVGAGRYFGYGLMLPAPGGVVVR
ncbi:type I-G CRISPR-associated protein Csb2 [Millisia brevis]|uniref:type I-G CRISPR-associated protein Csb2 n=1 Tax=Millisia brevis TaxID=264148 RepID=UPI000832064C|nr:type I-U CRISPR-associated protein Csb2 [Millisia brevis]